MTDSKNLENINVQQAGKTQLKKTLTQQALTTALKATHYAKKKGKKTITAQDLKKALKQ